MKLEVVFAGVGTSIIVFFLSLIAKTFIKKRTGPGSQKAKAGQHSQIIQAGRDAKVEAPKGTDESGSKRGR